MYQIRYGLNYRAIVHVVRRMHLFNFTFTVLDEAPETINTPGGNHALAILKTSETYDDLKSGLSDLIDEIENLQQILYNGKTHDIEYYMTGDWKFLALVAGIGAANSHYSCIWCKCSKDDRYRMDLEWSMKNTSNGARTVSEGLKYASYPKSHRLFAYSSSPLFPCIPTHRVIIDPLHLFLRIGDNLINLLITELRWCQNTSF